MRRGVAMWLLVLSAGCGGSDLTAVPAGNWGGEHVSMEVTNSGATLEFDCAHGSVPEPLTLDADGRFDRSGVFVREQGGPIREGEPEDTRPARYSGTTDGRSMSLTITIQDGSLPVQAYRLELGNLGHVFRCQ
jgi:hypothetical protein